MKPREIAIEATRVKTNFGEISMTVQSADIAVTKRGAVKAYIVSPQRYRAFTQRMAVDDSELERLGREFDRTVAGMQTSSHQAAVEQLMAASESDLQTALDTYYAGHPVPKAARPANRRGAGHGAKPAARAGKKATRPSVGAKAVARKATSKRLPDKSAAATKRAK